MCCQASEQCIVCLPSQTNKCIIMSVTAAISSDKSMCVSPSWTLRCVMIDHVTGHRGWTLVLLPCPKVTVPLAPALPKPHTWPIRTPLAPPPPSLFRPGRLHYAAGSSGRSMISLRRSQAVPLGGELTFPWDLPTCSSQWPHLALPPARLSSRSPLFPSPPPSPPAPPLFHGAENRALFLGPRLLRSSHLAPVASVLSPPACR